MKDEKYEILCIDDDEDLLHSLRLVLEPAGYRFIGALSAEEGLRLYRQKNPDFVIVDLMMEEVDAGTNFARELSAMGNQVPVYMLSSVGDQLSMSTDYSQMGLSGVLQKPLSPTALLATLKSHLS